MHADLHSLSLAEEQDSFSGIAHVALAPTRVAAMFARPGGAPGPAVACAGEFRRDGPKEDAAAKHSSRRGA